MQRILFIGGEVSTQAQLTHRLTKAGYRVHAVALGQDGLQTASNGDVGLVLCHTELPDMSGFDLAGQLRMNRKTLDIPIILMSPQLNLDDMRQCLQMDINDYLPTTAATDIIIDAVHKAIQSSLYTVPDEARNNLSLWMDDHHEQIAHSLIEEIQQPLHDLRTLTASAARIADVPIRSMVDNIDALASQAIATMDLLLVDIYPAKVNQLGFIPALYILIERYQTMITRPIRLDVATINLQTLPDITQQTVLLLIIRDLLAHYLQAVEAVDITLQLQSDENKITCEAFVDGIPGDADPNMVSLSLFTARQRANIAGGSLQIVAGVKSALHLHTWLPLQHPTNHPMITHQEPFHITPTETSPAPLSTSPFVDNDLPGDNQNYEELTRRQKEVFHGVATGLTNAEMASKWQISIRTVESHRASMMKKLQLQDKIDIVRYALKHKLISINDI